MTDTKEAVERLRQSLRNAAIMRTELASVWVSDARALLTALEAASGENVEQRAAAEFSAEAFDALNGRLTASNARVKALEEALERIATYGGDYTTGDGHAKCREIARSTLTEAPGHE